MSPRLKPSMWWWSAADQRVRPPPPILARRGHSVLLLDRAGRIKPCGGAIPPRLIQRVRHPARAAGRARDFGADGLAQRPPRRHADRRRLRRHGRSRSVRRMAAGARGRRRRRTPRRHLRAPRARRRRHGRGRLPSEGDDKTRSESARASVIGADGALSAVARQSIPGADRMPYVFAYHEIIRSPQSASGAFDGARCDVYYRGALSPDFYGWIFPHGDTTSVGTGSAHKGFSLRDAVGALARRGRPRRFRDHPARRRAHPAAPAAALGQRPRRRAGRRCRGRGRAGIGRRASTTP